jgi:hypothetical protein
LRECDGTSEVAKSSRNSERAKQNGEIACGMQIHFTRWMLIVLVVLIISPYLITAAVLFYPQVSPATNGMFAPRADQAESAQLEEGKPGPWGRLLYADMMIDIPDEFVRIPPPDQAPMRWFFRDYTRNQVIELLRSAEVAQSLLDNLPAGAWQEEAGGTWLTPGDELILALSPAARSKIYSILLAFPVNADRLDPLWFRPETLDEQLAQSGLSHSSIKLLKSLLYRNGPSKLLLFADKDTALRQIPGEGEKHRFIKAISRKATLMARLKIEAPSDAEALANYWSVGGRRKDILPLLNSLQHIEGGWNLSIVYLLPPFMRSHLYNYPFPSADTQAVKQDCFWTAFNAFSAESDDRCSDMGYVHELLNKEYYSIAQPSQLGDIVFLADSNNEAMHVAVYVADDIVFTKNGFHYTQPWILMHIKDLVETYAVRFPPGKTLNLLYYRKKTL